MKICGKHMVKTSKLRQLTGFESVQIWPNYATAESRKWIIDENKWNQIHFSID